MGSGELGKSKFYKLLIKALKRMKAALKDGSLAYLYMDKTALNCF